MATCTSPTLPGLLKTSSNAAYSPHSGRNLGIFQLTRSISELYGLSYPLAALLSIGGVLTCGRWGKVDLESLAKHNRIEHDASLVHKDLRDGDNKDVCPQLVSELLAESSNGRGLSWADLARARARREARIPQPLDFVHTTISRGESVLSVMVMGDGKEVPLDVAKAWYGEEKLPAGWMPHGTLVRRRHGGRPSQKLKLLCRACSRSWDSAGCSAG